MIKMIEENLDVQFYSKIGNIVHPINLEYKKLDKTESLLSMIRMENKEQLDIFFSDPVWIGKIDVKKVLMSNIKSDYIFYIVGYYYQYIEKNYNGAIYYYQKNENSYILMELGIIHYKGLFFNQDKEVGRKYIIDAIDKGNPHALYQLGKIYRQEGKYEMALKLFKKSYVDGNNSNALIEIAEMQINTGMAQFYYHISASMNNPIGLIRLGMITKEQKYIDVGYKMCFIEKI